MIEANAHKKKCCDIWKIDVNTSKIMALATGEFNMIDDNTV